MSPTSTARYILYIYTYSNGTHRGLSVSSSSSGPPGPPSFPRSKRWTFFTDKNPSKIGLKWSNLTIAYFFKSDRIHVWDIYLHLAYIYGKCREIYQSHGSYGNGLEKNQTTNVTRKKTFQKLLLMEKFHDAKCKKANVPMIIFNISTGTRGHFSVVLGGFQVSILFIWNDFDPQEIKENDPNLTCAYGFLNVWLNHQLRYWMDRWAMKKHGLVALYWCMYLQLYSLHTTSGECTAGESGTKAEL